MTDGMSGTVTLILLAIAAGVVNAAAPQSTGGSAGTPPTLAHDWPSWRGDGSGASHCGAEMVDATDYPTWCLGCHGLALLGPQATEAAPALAKRLDPSKPEHENREERD